MASAGRNTAPQNDGVIYANDPVTDEKRFSMEKTGQSLCGAVKFTAHNVETHHHACHCGMCRRWAGGPVFAASAERVTFDGQDHVARYDSSEWAARGFAGFAVRIFFII